VATGKTLLVAREDEEQKAQAVEPADDPFVVQPARSSQADAPSLGTTCDGARDVQCGRRRRGAGQDEPGRHRRGLLELGHQHLQALDLARSGDDEGLAGSGVSAQLGAERIESALQLLDDRPDAGLRGQRSRQAEGARSLVDRAVRLDPLVVLGGAPAAEQAGGPVVAAAGQLDEALAPRGFRRRPA
jgi:hypothetical protein